MSQAYFLWPEGRGLVRIAGPDARSFLQGIVSNDVGKVTPAQSIYAALLTPQGKYLHDFFIAELAGALFLDCEAGRREDLVRRLARYRLRSKVEVAAAPDDLAVALIYGGGALPALGLPALRGAAKPLAHGTCYVDPRHTDIGARAILQKADEAALADLGARAGEEAAYDRARIALGLPDGSRDLEIEKSILLENGFDELGGVDWDKGCYMGQELTARTHYRALIKKRLVPVRIDGPAPAAGTPVLEGAKEVGTMRSSRDGLGLALLRIEAMAGAAPLTAEAARLVPQVPAWFRPPG
ncbi:MAG: folate-binding protein YgfZ [Rhodospirillaceae bacterium]|nr:folate-binding protein YgfZ [Rhodospirillaceae bacterium]